MHRFQNYTDLRQNINTHHSDTSIWPSFTDIMTVILMIFMLTMIVVIIKNSNLSRQLMFLKNLKIELQEKLDLKAKKQTQLNIRITNLEERIRSKEMEIILLGDENQMLQSSLEAKLSVISALQVKVKELKLNMDDLEKELVMNITEREKMKTKHREKLSEYEGRISTISQETKRLIEEFNEKFAALSSKMTQKEEIIIVLNAEKKDLELSLARQRSDYSLLEEKYIKLIRPSRSPLGKQVVSVQFSKKKGVYRILYKGSDSGDFIELDRKDLHTRLDKLKRDLGDKLYVKIIIPENSGLTYNEAWGFTKNILSQYDYYYQGEK